jgi:hypothetical protein
MTILGAGGLGALAAAWLFVAYTVSDDRLPAGRYEPIEEPHWKVAPEKAEEIRADALARARVWRPPPVPIEQADLTRNAADDDDDGLEVTDPLACKFFPRAISGTTPKFDCVMPAGQVVKVKYGGTAENHAEIAGSRLLAALGFGADRMVIVPRVRCFGCPISPFRTYQALELARMHERYTRGIDYTFYRDFRWAAVERRFQAASIDTPEVKGWAFYELDRIDPARGGSPRSEVDALRLMAVFLHHWDNKSENQRLVCLAHPREEANGPCPEPFAFVQDLGSTFGPAKVEYARWSSRPVWTDPATCTVDMKDMPFGGATFGSARISEEGRLFLGDKLRRLSPAQVRGLFTAARFPEYHSRRDPGASPDNWVAAFQRKVREIVDRPPCPGHVPSIGAAPPRPSPPSPPSG